MKSPKHLQTPSPSRSQVWPVDQQHWHHLRAHQKQKLWGPALLNQNLSFVKEALVRRGCAQELGTCLLRALDDAGPWDEAETPRCQANTEHRFFSSPLGPVLVKDAGASGESESMPAARSPVAWGRKKETRLEALEPIHLLGFRDEETPHTSQAWRLPSPGEKWGHVTRKGPLIPLNNEVTRGSWTPCLVSHTCLY